jgi:hypothetical protein
VSDGSWPFDQAPNVAALTTLRVTRREAPILLVVHYADDHSWAFMDGGSNSVKNALIVSMQHVLNLDPSLRDVADLPPGWLARRAHVGAQWSREPNLGDDEVEGA